LASWLRFYPAVRVAILSAWMIKQVDSNHVFLTPRFHLFPDCDDHNDKVPDSSSQSTFRKIVDRMLKTDYFHTASRLTETGIPDVP